MYNYNNINNKKNNKELLINKVIKNNTKEYYQNLNEEINKELINNVDIDKLKEEETKHVKMAHKAYTNIDNRILKQIEKGINKYNEPVKPDNYSMIGWHNHLQDELVDALVYNEMKLMKLNEVLKELKIASKYNNDTRTSFHITKAISILEDGLNN